MTKIELVAQLTKKLGEEREKQRWRRGENRHKQDTGGVRSLIYVTFSEAGPFWLLFLYNIM